MKKKKPKLKLEAIKAESFVTKLDEPGADTVKGGGAAATALDERNVQLKIGPKGIHEDTNLL